ncbi:MAG: PAS domain-containing hybrid sensor histidine kinase/response regulator [Deferrisomatales bacterium]
MTADHGERDEERQRLLAAENARLAERVRELEGGVVELRREAAARAGAEAALRESEEKFRAAFLASPDAINLNRMDGVYADINEGFTALTGYTRDDVIGVSSLDLQIWAVPADRERLVAGLRAAGGVRNLQSVFRCKDGSLKTALMSARVVSIRGEPHILSVTRDISERVRAEEAVRASEERLSILVEQAVDGILVGSPEGIITGANSRLLAMAGRGRDELVGQHIRVLFSAECLDERPLRFDLLRRGDTVITERDLRRPDGSDLPIEMHSKRMDDGTYQSIVRDVSARRAAQQALRESEARFRTVVENAEAVIFVVDAEGRFQLSEGRALARLGLAPGQGIGTSAFHRYRAYPEVLGSLRQALGGEPVHTTVQAEGMVFDARLSPLRDPRGRVTGVLGVATDVTGRVRAEEARLELERQLLHAQKLESLGVMAGGIAHDFNNLLMAVLGNLELSEARLPPGSPAAYPLGQAIRAALRAADLTRQLLAYTGKEQLTVQALDVSGLVEESAHLLRAALARNVTLDLRLAPDLPPVLGDPSQLQQVAMNLITNASEAVGEGAGEVTLATEVRELDAAALSRSRVDEPPPPGRFVCLRVADTGCGMDDATQRQLFDPFFTTKFTGRGLGLAAVLGIVKGHRGAILVDSEVGRGTSIAVLLPAAPGGDPPGPRDRSVAGELAGAGRLAGTVLVVDDEPMVRESTAATLGELGLAVLCAADGEEAAALYRRRAAEIDAVLLDLTMPRMDGVACLEALRAVRPDVAVLLVTGFSADDAARRLAGRGIAGVLPKPCSRARLAEALGRVLGR